MRSCLYEGRVMHQRYAPVGHGFSYNVSMIYLDLEELPDLIGPGGLISTHLAAPISFRTTDHLLGCQGDLLGAVRAKMNQLSGTELASDAPAQPIGLLTQLRHFGYYFSPLNLYFTENDTGTESPRILAEVNNTPWNEQHHYLLSAANQTRPDRLEFSHPKNFHVSPFMDMDLTYRWNLTSPGETCQVSIETFKGDQPQFVAAMSLKKRELTRASLERSLIRYPVMTAQITAAIYLQALKLWWKKCPVFRHPRT